MGGQGTVNIRHVVWIFKCKIKVSTVRSSILILYTSFNVLIRFESCFSLPFVIICISLWLVTGLWLWLGPGLGLQRPGPEQHWLSQPREPRRGQHQPPESCRVMQTCRVMQSCRLYGWQEKTDFKVHSIVWNFNGLVRHVFVLLWAMKWEFEYKTTCIFPSFANISIMYFIVNWGHAALAAICFIVTTDNTRLHLTGDKDTSNQFTNNALSEPLNSYLFWDGDASEATMRCVSIVFIPSHGASHDGSSSPDRQASSCNFYWVDLANIFSESFNWNLGFKIYVCKVSNAMSQNVRNEKKKVLKVVALNSLSSWKRS